MQSLDCNTAILNAGPVRVEEQPIAVVIDNPEKAAHFYGELEKQKGTTDFAKAEVVYREGLTPDYATVRLTYWGQGQPVNYSILKKAYLEDPIINAAINVTAEAIVADGYELGGKVGLHNRRVDKMLGDNAWYDTMMSVVLELLIYGDSYVELVRENSRRRFYSDVGEKPKHSAGKLDAGSFKRGYSSNGFTVKEYASEKDYYTDFVQDASKEKGKVWRFYPTDAASVRIDYNEHGEVLKYIQRVNFRRVDFYPDEMVHFTLRKFGGRVYGNTSLASVLFNLQAKILAENYTTDYFRRGAIPRVVYIMKSNFSEEQLRRFTDKLKTLAPWMDLVVTGDVEMKEIAPNNTDLQFRELLGYLRENILIALQVPPVLVGLTEGANRNTSETQMEAFDRHIRFLKMVIGQTINQQLLTEENFDFSDIDFSWSIDNKREELKEVQMAQLASTMVLQDILTAEEVRTRYLGLEPMTAEQKAELEAQRAERMAQQAMSGGFGGKPGGKPGGSPMNSRNPLVANPSANMDKKDRAESQNVERQMEHKFLDFVSKSQFAEEAARHSRDPYPFGAAPAEKVRTDRELSEYHAEREELTDTILRNPIDNALELNHDREFNHYDYAGRKPAPKGKRPKGDPSREGMGQHAPDGSSHTKGLAGEAAKEHAEHPWTTEEQAKRIASDHEREKRKKDSHKFYEGTDQLDELGIG